MRQVAGGTYATKYDFMKLKFKPQAFQTDAVAAVVDLFRGQERQDTFAITNELQSNFSYTGFCRSP